MREYKIIVLGNSGVGKSSLTFQFIQGIFVERYNPTVEDSYEKQVNIDGKEYILEILDTAETDQLKCMRDVYIRDGHGFVLVYSITSQSSFIDLLDIREHILFVKGEPNVPIVIVGNKCDLEDERCVGTNHVLDLAKQFNDCLYIEASAKENINVDEIFHELVKDINVKMTEKNSKKKLRCNLI